MGGKSDPGKTRLMSRRHLGGDKHILMVWRDAMLAAKACRQLLAGGAVARRIRCAAGGGHLGQVQKTLARGNGLQVGCGSMQVRFSANAGLRSRQLQAFLVENRLKCCPVPFQMQVNTAGNRRPCLAWTNRRDHRWRVGRHDGCIVAGASSPPAVRRQWQCTVCLLARLRRDARLTPCGRRAYLAIYL